MTEITIPSVGIAMEEALVLRWLKEPGDAVAVDDPIAEIETDKATMEIVSPVAGTLGAHLVEPGAIVAVGVAIVHVIDGRSQPDAEASVDARAPVAAPPADSAPETVEGERAAHRLSPRARRLARERGVETAAPIPGAPAAADGRFRELIAAKVSESWREIPHFTVSRDVDAEALQATLASLRAEAFEPQPTLTDLLLRALARALQETGAGDGSDVGLAVATPHGVVIPVVRNVLGRGPAALARARSEAVERARQGKLGSGDLSAAPRTTLSNLGAFGVDRFTGIIAHGQTSLLTVGRALPRVVADERRAITVRTLFSATLNADHRTVDGAEAARLLVAFAVAAESMSPDGWEGSI